MINIFPGRGPRLVLLFSAREFNTLTCFICIQSEEDASVHARVCSHPQLPGAHGGAALEQEHQG